MAPLREIMVKQAGVLGNLESNLPASAPRLSQLMTSIASTFPINPNLPNLPMGLGGGARPSGLLSNLITGIDDFVQQSSRDNGNDAIPISQVLGDIDPSLPSGSQILS